ncbi:MAG: hypothetical protein CFE24_05060 [Flavobacterium sp. BFFFF2]|nr:MAG: hypothetical protein CFE24_05060 [Flavobacterium sp. BFFFF2]
MKKYIYFISGAFFLVSTSIFAQVQKAQTVQVGSTPTNTVAASAALQVDDTTRGFLLPRMTTARRLALPSPATGLQVFDTDSKTAWYYNGTVWVNNDTVEDGDIGSMFTKDPVNGLIYLNQLSDGTTARGAGKEFVIRDDSCFGIGTSTMAADALCDVNGLLLTNGGFLNNPNTSGGTTSTISFKTGSSTNNSIINSNSTLGFYNNNPNASMTFSLADDGSGSSYYSFLRGKMAIGGTVAPTQQLDVTGNVKFSGTLLPNSTAGTSGQVLTTSGANLAPTWGNPRLLYSLDSSLSANRTVALGSNTLAFNSSVANSFSVDSGSFSVDGANNRVGIGTTAPQSIVHVQATDDTSYNSAAAANAKSTFVIQNSNTAATVNPVAGLQLQTNHNDGVNTRTSYIAAVGGLNNFANDLVFGSNVDATTFSEKMRLSAAGNLGIGTAAPSQKVEVTGNVKFSGALMPNNNAGTAGQILTSAATAVPTWTTRNTLYENDATLTSARTVTQAANTLAFTATSTNAFSVAGSTFSVDAANKRVGIGTTAPTSTLHDNGTFALNTATSGTATSVVLLSTGTFTPPTASTVPGRVYIVRNTSAATNVSVATLVNFGATTSSTVSLTPAIGSVMMVSNGTSWFRIN